MATLTIHPDYRPLLQAAGLDTFDALFQAAEGRQVDGHRSRGVSRIEVGREPDGPVGIYVKRFWGRAARPRWRDLLRLRRPMTPARYECVASQRLLQAGVEVARPVAWGASRDAGQPRALVAFREVEGPSLAEWLDRQPAAGCITGLDARHRRSLAEALGHAVRRIHEACFSYPDLYAKHVYVEDADTVYPRIVLIDVQRLRRLWPWRRVRDLAALHVSTEGSGVRRTDRLRFLRAYLGGSPTSRRARRLIRRVERKAAQMPGRGRDPNLIAARRSPAPGVTSLAHETMTEVDGGRLLVNEAFRPMLQAAGLTTLDAIMNVGGGETYREGFGRSTVRLELADPAGTRPRAVYVKRYTRVPLRVQVRRTLSLNPPQSRARHEVRGMLRLADLGIPTMRCVALGEGLLHRGRQERSCLVTEEIEGATQADDYFEARFSGPLTPALQAEKRGLIGRIADLARRMHAANLSHRDFYLCHILIRPVEGGEPILHLIDLQRLTHHRRGIGRRWIVKDLAALLFSSWPGPATGIRSPVFTDSDRLRFARTYFQTGRLTAEQKDLLRAVVRKAGRIALHDARRRRRAGGTA
ncbi:MAG: hypothetical protein ISS74_03100 [Planctomycetes bacterium]|nr:hypothetical protein [Planctomycetota bacterium]